MHKRSPNTNGHGQPYCEACGLLEAEWTAFPECKGSPTLSVAPASTLSYVEAFNADPFAWLAEWNRKNGKVVAWWEETTGYTVQLWVDGMRVPIATAVCSTLIQAYQRAVEGAETVTGII